MSTFLRWHLWLLALCWASALTAGAVKPSMAAPVQATSGGITVTLRTDPSVIPVGRARLMLEVRAAGKPVEDAQVSAFVHMPSMDMGEREQPAKPVAGKPGTYEAEAVFAMAGAYVAEVRIRQGEQEQLVSLKLATGQDTSPGVSPWPLRPIVWGMLVLALALFTLYRMKATGQSLSLRFLARRNVWLSVVLLAAAVAVAVYSVKRWRRPGAMTPIEAQAMEMATPPPPGTAIVRTALVDRGAVTETVAYTGQAAGWVEQDVNPRVNGWIVEMPVYAGTRVRRGDILARLDTSQIRPVVAGREAGAHAARLEAGVAEAEEAQARAAVVKAKENVAVQEAAARAADAAVRSAEAELQAARQDLDAARADVLEARAMLDAATADDRYWSAELRRMKALAARGAVSADELQSTESQTSKAASAVQQAEARLKKAEAAVGSAQARLAAAESAREAALQEAARAHGEKAAAVAETAMVEAGAAAAGRRKAAASARALQERAMAEESRTLERYTVVRAEADGVVIERRVPPGVYVTAGQTILRVAQSAPIRLQAYVSESDLARVRVGAPVRAWATARPRDVIHTRISSVAPFVDPRTRTALVEALWPNTEGRFAVGDTVRMVIEVGRVADAVRVPTEAVSEMAISTDGVEPRGTRYSVFVLEPGAVATVRRTEFVPGVRGDRYYAVRRGLSPGDRVVVDGRRNLRDGDQVTDTSAAHTQQHEHGTGAAASQGTSDRAVFTCPMHPDVIRNGPGRCPKCGMALVAKEPSR